ncbi:MAG: tetratricopeptide repeat protein [Planctomycetota bacterium]
MPEEKTRRWPVFLAACVLVLAGLAAYHNSFGGPFIFHDYGSIVENASIYSFRPIWRPLSPKPPYEGAAVSGRPVLNLSLAINYAISGLKVWSYHVLNLAIHVLAGLVLFGIVRRTLLLPRLRQRFGKAATPLALAIGLIWVIHPLQSESVAYVIQRAESLAGLFYFLTLYCVILGATTSRPGLWYSLGFLACLLGMGTKEVMVSAPLIVLLYDRAFLAGSFRQAWRKRWDVHLRLAATWVLLGYLTVQTGNRGGTAGFGLGLSLWDHVRTQCFAFLHYLRLCFWPDPLVIDYGGHVVTDPLWVVPGAVVVVLLLGGCVLALRYRPALGLVGVAFFAALAPTSSFIPLPTRTLAEHRMYLPLASVVIVVVMGAYLLCQKLLARSSAAARRVSLALLALVLAAVSAALGYRTVLRSRDYQSEITIWQKNVEDHKGNARAHCSLGNALAKEGRTKKAIDQYRSALELDKSYLLALDDLGNVFALRGRLDDAILCYEAVLEVQPNHAKTLNDMGAALSRKKLYGEALTYLKRSVSAEPRSAQARANLAAVYKELGQTDNAIRNYERAIALQPNIPMALKNLALLYATRRPPRQKELTRAVKLAIRACELTDNNNPAVLDTLAITYAADGNFEQAIHTALRAIELAGALEQKKQLAKEIEQRLELYRDGKPWLPPETATRPAKP